MPPGHWTSRNFTEVKSSDFFVVEFTSDLLTCEYFTNESKVVATSCSLGPIGIM